MNTHVSDRNTEERGEVGTPVRHIQSIDSSSETIASMESTSDSPGNIVEVVV
jgi:hypothetical protein